MIPSQSLTCSWGGMTDLKITSFQFQGSASGEIDVTGMDATISSDPENTKNKVVRKSTEYAVLDYGEITVDFFATSTGVLAIHQAHRYIGMKRLLTFSQPSSSGSAGFTFTHYASLTSFSFQAATGDMIRGSCTFKLSDQ